MLPTHRRCISWLAQQYDWGKCRDARGHTDVYVRHIMRNGHIFPHSVPHEIPIHQQDSIALFSSNYRIVQLPVNRS